MARLRGPAWREWAPALDECERLPAGLRARAMRLRYRLIAGELRAVGIDVNCAPVLDLARRRDPRGHPQPLLRRAIPPRWRRSGGRWPRG